ncbi:hypothetical protein H0H92_003262 [Tricholoma furcatifolium]|nr:hypothetical protein H0H92_003262 [Tricholoma furcatifolium]
MQLHLFNTASALSRICRTQEGHDLLVRVIVIGDEGHDHLKILRKLACGPLSLYPENHTLPMFREFQFEDIIFGAFPMVGGSVYHAHALWPRNTAGDVLDMLLQMLEGLAFIHKHKIAHRDAFSDNFLVQWQPESMVTKTMAVSRPRVYLIDFEVAIEFPEDCPVEQCTCVGPPIGGSFPSIEMYKRQRPPEVDSGKPYDPFKLDVWQLASSMSGFKVCSMSRSRWVYRCAQRTIQSTIPAIDDVLAAMADLDAMRRPTAQDALDQLHEIIISMPPKSLILLPVGPWKL